jgi:addiction module HigA family antidote
MPRVKTHPGEVLREEFMLPFGLSSNALARDLHVTPNRISAIVSKENPRAVSTDTAPRLARYFGTTPEFWLNLQRAYDLSLAETQLRSQIDREVQPRAA